LATVQSALQTQIRNIEAEYGRSMDEWTELIRASGLSRHGQIVAMLKQDHGLSHGSANRVALVVLAALEPDGSSSAAGGLGGSGESPSGATTGVTDPAQQLYADRPALRPIHDRLITEITSLGPDIEIVPKKGYLSLRRRTQFAMIKPAARHIDLGLILPNTPVTDRFESAATWNAMFSHRVRVRSNDDVDAELTTWIGRAYARAN
jgi:predicted transport protein